MRSPTKRASARSAERAELTKSATAPQRARSDPQVETIAMLIGTGRHDAIRYGLNAMTGFGVQVLGEARPRIVLFLLFVAFSPVEAERRRKQKAKPIEPPALTPEETDGSDPEISAFLLRNTVRIVGGKVRSEKLFEAWCADAVHRGVEAGTQRAFTTRVKRFATLEVRNNRGAWLGISLKACDEAPRLRVIER